MSRGKFFGKPFDEGTLTKLEIFELYAREWLPVFLSRANPIKPKIQIFDFFAGPGLDSKGQSGSPLRLLKQLNIYRALPGWSHVAIHVHFFDKSSKNVKTLKRSIENSGLSLENVALDIRRLDFETAFEQCSPLLKDRQAAKLVFIDQFGVDQVTDEVFRRLINFPTCDFLFFISSSTLHRFRDHPAIKQRIDIPNDSYSVHRTVFEYYQNLLPDSDEYYLAPFSIRKVSNIYGLIFGSAHIRGIEKFLAVAWNKDAINGEANFDINREDNSPGQMLFPLDTFKPTKVGAFESTLERRLRSGHFSDEEALLHFCLCEGFTPRHAKRLLAKLKTERVIKADFQVPQHGQHRLITVVSG
jgi:three-Cys-motif partner protein